MNELLPRRAQEWQHGEASKDGGSADRPEYCDAFLHAPIALLDVDARGRLRGWNGTAGALLPLSGDHARPSSWPCWPTSCAIR